MAASAVSNIHDSSERFEWRVGIITDVLPGSRYRVRILNSSTVIEVGLEDILGNEGGLFKTLKEIVSQLRDENKLEDDLQVAVSQEARIQKLESSEALIEFLIESYASVRKTSDERRMLFAPNLRIQDGN